MCASTKVEKDYSIGLYFLLIFNDLFLKEDPNYESSSDEFKCYSSIFTASLITIEGSLFLLVYGLSFL